MVDTCGLRDLGYEGQWWTWERGRTPQTRVRERLDRFMASTEWSNLFPNATVTHLLKNKSDHCPIVARLTQHRRPREGGRRSFRFETAWLLEEGCENIVKEAWDGGVGAGVMERIGGWQEVW